METQAKILYHASTAVERALDELDRLDAREQRAQRWAAVAALAVIAGIFSVPAAMAWLGGWSLGWIWLAGGLLGAAPLWRLVRRFRDWLLLERCPLPPLLKTSMWLEGVDEGGAPSPVHAPVGPIRTSEQSG